MTAEQIKMLNPKKLKWLYKIDKLTIAQLSEKIGVSTTTISKRLREYKIRKHRGQNGLTNLKIGDKIKYGQQN